MARPRTLLTLAGAGAAAVVAARIHYAARPEDIPNPYAATHLTIAVTSGIVGTLVAWRRPGHPIGWVLLTAGLLGAWTYAAQPLGVELFLAGAPEWVHRAIAVMVVWPWIAARSMLLVVAPSVIPHGWPTGARRWILAAGLADTAVFCAAQIVFQLGMPLDESAPPPTGRVYDLASDAAQWTTRGQWLVGVIAIGALVVVTVTSRDRLVRRQTRWFVLAAAVLAVPGLSTLGAAAWPERSWPAGDVWEKNASGLLPLALGAAVVFDHFLDVRIVLRRAVLYGGLIVFGAAVYSAFIGVASVTTGIDDSLQQAIAAGTSAVALLPAWSFWRTWVDNHVYGDSSRPERVLAQLGRQLSDARSSHEAVQGLVDTLAVSLRLPHVAIEIDLGGDLPPVVEATRGDPGPLDERIPLVYSGETLGQLVIGRRTGGDDLRTRDRELLADLAGHVGVVLHDARLEAQLRASREQIVRTREEERRRLRADLHDGLGPTLASVAMGLDAATVAVDNRDLSTLLGDLGTDLRGAIADIRRLVYGLRPPSLDELGLVRAVEHHARAVEARASGLHIKVTSCDLPDVPAAVEVAAYRIVLEAMTNVSRHARAASCTAHLGVENESLVVEVRDDGVGLSPSKGAGVGLTSMRERADELGGHVSVTSNGTGTTVRATLPLSGWKRT